MAFIIYDHPTTLKIFHLWIALQHGFENLKNISNLSFIQPTFIAAYLSIALIKH